MRGGTAVTAALFSLAIILSPITAHAWSPHVKVLRIETVLTRYNLTRATYKGEPINVTLEVAVPPGAEAFNVSVTGASGAFILRSGSIKELIGEARLNATLLIPNDASPGPRNLTLYVTYYTLPRPTQVCVVNESNITLYACIYTNVSAGEGVSLYVYTYPYVTKELLVKSSGRLVLNTTIYSWGEWSVPGPGTYVVKVTSFLGNASVTAVSEAAVPQPHTVTAVFNVTVIPRNVTLLDVTIDAERNAIAVCNRGDLSGQLIVYNASVRMYRGTPLPNGLEWVLKGSYTIKELPLGSCRVIRVPWSLRSDPLLNATVSACDDVHGCRVVNYTYLPPTAEACGEVVFKVTDFMGRPLSGAEVVMNGVKAWTDSRGLAVMRTYPLGEAVVRYRGKVVRTYVAGCGTHLIKVDLTPPHLINVASPGLGLITIKAVDETPMHAWVNNYGPYGPFNKSITLYLPFIHSDTVHVIVEDAFNNTASVNAPFTPVRTAKINYVLLGELSVAAVIVLFIGFKLLLR